MSFRISLTPMILRSGRWFPDECATVFMDFIRLIFSTLWLPNYLHVEQETSHESISLVSFTKSLRLGARIKRTHVYFFESPLCGSNSPVTTGNRANYFITLDSFLSRNPEKSRYFLLTKINKTPSPFLYQLWEAISLFQQTDF